jgi:hypothetical protein
MQTLDSIFGTRRIYHNIDSIWKDLLEQVWCVMARNHMIQLAWFYFWQFLFPIFIVVLEEQFVETVISPSPGPVFLVCQIITETIFAQFNGQSLATHAVFITDEDEFMH